MRALQRNQFERYLTETEERQLFKAVDSQKGSIAERDAAWLRLLRHTGIRVGTLAGLTLGDAKTALRDKKLTLRPEISKNQRGHSVYLNTVAQKALRKLVNIRLTDGYPRLETSPLVLSRHGQALSIRSYQTRCTHWAKTAGINPDFSPHWLRHTLAKRLMDSSTAKDPRAIVMAVLGHSDISTTAVYTLPDRQDIENAMEEIR